MGELRETRAATEARTSLQDDCDGIESDRRCRGYQPAEHAPGCAIACMDSACRMRTHAQCQVKRLPAEGGDTRL
eukprot:358578-Chlamydomonas_euryale.AAC.3